MCLLNWWKVVSLSFSLRGNKTRLAPFVPRVGHRGWLQTDGDSEINLPPSLRKITAKDAGGKSGERKNRQLAAAWLQSCAAMGSVALQWNVSIVIKESGCGDVRCERSKLEDEESKTLRSEMCRGSRSGQMKGVQAVVLLICMGVISSSEQMTFQFVAVLNSLMWLYSNLFLSSLMWTWLFSF